MQGVRLSPPCKIEIEIAPPPRHIGGKLFPTGPLEEPIVMDKQILDEIKRV